jgi:hypothetical protein
MGDVVPPRVPPDPVDVQLPLGGLRLVMSKPLGNLVSWWHFIAEGLRTGGSVRPSASASRLFDVL